MKFTERKTLTSKRRIEIMKEVRAARTAFRNATTPEARIHFDEQDRFLRQLLKQNWEYVQFEVTRYAGLIG